LGTLGAGNMEKRPHGKKALRSPTFQGKGRGPGKNSGWKKKGEKKKRPLNLPSAGQWVLL